MVKFSGDYLKELGFEYIEDDQECYYQFVLDPNNYFESDYLYSEKVGMGEYKVVQYAGGENKDLLLWEVRQLTGDIDYKV